jgi:hypothetical protein
LLAALSVAAVSLGTTFGKEFFGAAFAGYTFGSLLTRGIEAISGDEHYEGGFFSQMADIKESFTDGSWKEAGKQWGSDIVDGWNKAFMDFTPEGWLLKMDARLRGMDGEDFDSILEARIEIVKHDFLSLHEHIKEFSEIAAAMLIGLGERIAENNEKVRQNIVTFIASVKVHWLNLKNSISETVTNITSKVSQFATDVKNFFAPVLVVINNVKSAFDSLAKLDFSSLGNFANLSEGGTGLLDIISKYLNKNSYATGGFPEDGLFMANHGELVGSFSNGRTAVANNDQIVEGIRQGVFEAVSAAMANNGTSEPVVKVYLDSREIRTGQQRLNRAMGV